MSQEIFEVHITGDESIIQVAQTLGLKTISIDLLKPDKSRLRTEYMTSQVFRFGSYNECKFYIDCRVKELEKHGVQIIRVKIESPDYPHYRSQSCYMESHFNDRDGTFPMSRNLRKTSVLATSREYDKNKYDEFHELYKDVELELCLFDSFVGEDADWFSLY